MEEPLWPKMSIISSLRRWNRRAVSVRGAARRHGTVARNGRTCLRSHRLNPRTKRGRAKARQRRRPSPPWICSIPGYEEPSSAVASARAVHNYRQRHREPSAGLNNGGSSAKPARPDDLLRCVDQDRSAATLSNPTIDRHESKNVDDASKVPGSCSARDVRERL